jgi:hypothetical protein
MMLLLLFTLVTAAADYLRLERRYGSILEIFNNDLCCIPDATNIGFE